MARLKLPAYFDAPSMAKPQRVPRYFMDALTDVQCDTLDQPLDAELAARLWRLAGRNGAPPEGLYIGFMQTDLDRLGRALTRDPRWPRRH
jgi:hypothetical protein